MEVAGWGGGVLHLNKCIWREEINIHEHVRESQDMSAFVFGLFHLFKKAQ